ncbi:MAG TPA: hypothetical protein VI456_02970 [Polyangia bacterium]
MRSARVVSVSAALAPLLVGLTAVTGVAAAAGEPVTAGARLEVRAPPDCTTREELAARVAARSRRIRFDDDAPGPTLRAIIAPGPRGGAVGELQISEPGGRTATRRIFAPSCAQATDAIALIIALTLDPTSAASATSASPSAPATPTPPPGPLETPPAPNAPAPAPTGEASGRSTAPLSETPHPRAPARVVAPPADEASAVVVASPVAARHRFEGGVAGEVVSGPAPAALPGLAVYLLAALDRDALWSPAAIVRGTHAWTNGLVEPGGTAAFTLDAVTLDACLLRLAGSTFEARACASGLYGRLAATGTQTYSPATASRPYAAAGGAVVLSAAIGQLLEISGRIGGGASLVRDSFAFSPTVFHRTAAGTLAASLGIGLRFP